MGLQKGIPAEERYTKLSEQQVEREAGFEGGPMKRASGSEFSEVELGRPVLPVGPPPPRYEAAVGKAALAPEVAAEAGLGPLPGKGAEQPAKSGGLIRHVVAVLALTSIVLANMNRQAFNQSLVNMVRLPVSHGAPVPLDSAAPQPAEPVGELAPAPEPADPAGAAPSDEVTMRHVLAADEEDRFDWSGAQIGLLQAAFSYGYTPFMIAGGRLSEVYGAKWVVFASGIGSALCLGLAPFLADTNYNLLVGARIVMGLCQTGVSPALYALLTRWLPPNECSIYLPMIKVGVMVGFMLGSLISGFFSWRVTFYSIGLIGLCWSTVWALFVTSDPKEHRILSRFELTYIRSEICASIEKHEREKRAAAAANGAKLDLADDSCNNNNNNNGNNGNNNNNSNNCATLTGKQLEEQAKSLDARRTSAAPWFRILTNRVVVSFMLAKFTVKLSTDAQSMQLPLYLKEVFHISKELNGVFSAANFAIQATFTGLIAWLAKEFIVRRWFGLDKTGVRRLFQGICNTGMALACLLITFNMDSLALVAAALILMSVSSIFGAGGEAILPADLSFEYSASIMAIANTAANMSGIVLPQLVALILGDQLASSERWNQVWWMVGAILMVGTLIFSFFVRAEYQNFSEPAKMDGPSGEKLPAKALGLPTALTIIEMDERSAAKSSEGCCRVQ